MTISATQSMNSIDRFLQEVAATEKTAAEAHTEPGSVGGATEHPVKDVDDFTEEAKEGFRSAENDADVKADQGPPSVDNTPENVAAKKAYDCDCENGCDKCGEKSAVDGKSESGNINPPGTAAEDQIQIGTKKEPTGQDPSVETSSAKAEKEDPASAPEGHVGHSTSPARTNNSELDGYKYAELDLDQHAKVASDLGNALLVTVSNMDKKAEEECEYEGVDEKDDKSVPEVKEAQADIAGQAGWELAGLLSGNFDKQAADAMVHDTLTEIINTASNDAEKVAEYLYAYHEELQKQAEAEMPAGIDPAALGGAEEAEAGMPPEAAGEEAAMADAMAGGDEAALAGGGEDVEQLAMVLEQLGISPEELEAAMAAQAGGLGGEEEALGGAPELGGEEALAEEPAADEAAGMEVEASAKEAAAKKGSASKSTRDYIQEVLERSRR